LRNFHVGQSRALNAAFSRCGPLATAAFAPLRRTIIRGGATSLARNASGVAFTPLAFGY
jgi:hypothetical protein